VRPRGAAAASTSAVTSVGDETLKVVGSFAESEIVSSFAEPIQRIGLAVVEQGAHAPATA
jgi:hypothetical protein